MPTHFSLKPGCTILPFHGVGADEHIVETPDARRFKLSGAAFRLIERLDRGESVEELCMGFSNMTCDDLSTLILKNYGDLLVYRSGESFSNRPTPPRAAARNGLLVSCTVVSRAVTGVISSHLSFFFAPAVAALSLVFILVAHLLVYSHAGRVNAHLAGAHVSVILALCFLSVLAHEFGHASALSRYGGSPNGIGFGLYILLPVFYADVSQAWRLRRWQRIVVDIGGVYFQQLFFAFTALLATVFGGASLRAVCVAIDVMSLIALNPAFRFDGYWVITDWLGLTHLHRAATAYIRSLIASVVRSQSPRGDHPTHLGRTKTTVFIGYALLSSVFLALLVALNVRWVYSAALGLVTGLPDIGRAFLRALNERNWVGSADLAVAWGFLLASGVTLIIGVGYQIKAVVRILRRKYSPTGPTSSPSLGAQL